MSNQTPEPTITFTKRELIEQARKLTFENYQKHELDARYERLGLLVEFISKLFEGTKP